MKSNRYLSNFSLKIIYLDLNMDKINQESLFKVHGEEYKKNFPKIQINEDRPLIRSPTEDDKNGRSD